MASDYEKILRENISPSIKGLFAILAQLYTERTHFIFELLQNAEDAGAKRVEFKLYRDRLELWHDGRAFDEKDVRGICGIAEGTKAHDLTKIGKFGIGFKSVYAYTSSPEVHSGEEHFCIEDYIRRDAVPEHSMEKPWTTLFIFPFNHPEVTAEQAFEEIEKRLVTLHDERPLLFLRSLKVIISYVEDVPRNVYYLPEHTSLGPLCRRLHLESDESNEEWLVLERPLEDEGQGTVRVEVAFRVVKEEKTNQDRIMRLDRSPLVVFFPTEKETRLGFLIQGPYRTTPARDNIPKDDAWNQQLIRETALLVCDGLFMLKERGLLTVSALETMPLREADFPPESMFRPIYDQVRTVLTEEALLPTDDDSFTAAKYAKLAGSVDLRALLGEEQLQLLYNTPHKINKIKWLSGAITRHRTENLWTYLRQELDVEEVTPANFARDFSASFIKPQSDEWVVKFYGFLAEQRSLWPVHKYLRRPSLRDKPFIRLENGTHLAPFQNNKIPNAYLPPEQETTFPIVKRKIASDEQARAFLEALGLTEPNQVDEVLQRLLPKYQQSAISINHEQEHEQDIAQIVRTLQSDLTKKQRQLLIAELKKTPFLQANNASRDETAWRQPTHIYMRTEELQLYFEDNPAAWFLDARYEQSTLFSEAGVRSSVPITCREANSKGYVIIKSYSPHKRGTDGFDPDANIDGLDYAFAPPTLEKARYIWNKLLSLNLQHIRGTVEESTRKDYPADHTKRTEMFSKMGELVTQEAWLPDQKGNFHQPSELTLDDLPPEFQRNERLAKQLEMRTTSLATLAKEADIDLEYIEFLKTQPKEFKKIFESWKAKQEKKKKKDDDGGSLSEEEATFNYRSKFQASFDRPQRHEIDNEPIAYPRGAVSNPAHRRDKTAEEIKEQQQEEPARSERFKKVPTKQWEGKNNEARTFLEEEYQGKCQICDTTFLKRDGRPYFEGLYLVPYTQRRWIDRPGNVLCLCATCCAKFKHGSVEAEEDVLSQVERWRASREGGSRTHGLHVKLCGEEIEIRFRERHIIDLQELLTASSGAS
jgi:hypothetical protein